MCEVNQVTVQTPTVLGDGDGPRGGWCKYDSCHDPEKCKGLNDCKARNGSIVFPITLFGLAGEQISLMIPQETNPLAKDNQN